VVSYENLPFAYLQPQITLGGKDRLTAIDAQTKSNIFMQIAIWILLVMGAGGLALLTFKVWKETQADKG